MSMFLEKGIRRLGGLKTAGVHRPCYGLAMSWKPTQGMYGKLEILKFSQSRSSRKKARLTSRAGLSNILEDLKCKSLDWTLQAVENDMDQTVPFSKLYPAAILS